MSEDSVAHQQNTPEPVMGKNHNDIPADQELLDEDGYPTDFALNKIKAWPYQDMIGLFGFMKSIWRWTQSWQQSEVRNQHFPDDVYTQIEFATGGWSGNESIIAALKSNHIAWTLSWHQITRGGHYVFRFRPVK